MIPDHFPNICARCGSQNIVTHRVLNIKQSNASPLTSILTWFGVSISRIQPETFSVPICRKCASILERVRLINRRLTISLAIFLGLVFGIMYLLAAFHGTHLFGEIIGLLVVVLVGAAFGTFIGLIFGLVLKEGLNYDFCEYDGRYFRRSFAAQYPSLIKLRK